MNEQSVSDEIRKFIADKIDRKEPVIVSWITTEILERKSNVEGADAPFYLTCARKFIRDVVSRVIGKYDGKPNAVDAQIVLPGFEYLQRAYTVMRAGEVTLVPVDMLIDHELISRAKEYEEMAKGCRRHAYEIREFVRSRSEQRESMDRNTTDVKDFAS